MDNRRTFGSDQPPALLHLFEAPDGHIGSFGWLCGYSADAFFLDAAAERFTRRTQRRRAAEGEVALGLILDPGSPRVSIVDAPGVLHLPLPPNGAHRLMHAKVALLGFRPLGRDGWRLRLVVSSGNWTRETLEESLDLACQIEIGSDEVGQAAAAQRLADLAAGSNFLKALRDRIDAAPLQAASRLTREAVAALDRWCVEAAANAPTQVQPRFIDSRTQALLPQIIERIAPARRNYLAMGSGFYEGRAGDGVPQVPAQVVATLTDAGHLAPRRDIDLFVKPGGCQAVAGAMAAIADAGWIVRKPGQGPFRRPRELHAKFLFGAQYDRRSPRCRNAWLYLGSGNLTHPGLLRAGPSGGNLEAGIVLAPEGLIWEDGSNGVPVKAALPISWEAATLLDPEDVDPGGEMPERTEGYCVAPVSHMVWTPASDRTGRLRPPGETALTVTVLDPSGTVCIGDGRSVLWPGSCPPEVTLTWTVDGQARSERVPVIDGQGRVGATALAPVALDEVWGLLIDFPAPPADDDDGTGTDDGGEDDDSVSGDASRRGAASAPGDYPIRQVMALIERIAARQTELHPADWTAWCVRLGQTLELAGADAGVEAFRTLGLDPFSALRAAPFRPDFARDAASPEGQLYEDTLERAATAWQVAGFATFEA
ncbi:hypothetical protein IPV08_22325 [Methylobacterium sp. SD274]|uniref:hypothetical protein n=1 Tax=Methylobacterium sp. SD274 TaxID=2782009 RepID=UPI001A958995|nr:hypothetical protein [Methylobacterium sp. SD274]MBO1022701.1 hypothetical protein [Methylobacterium sp. SD274]